MYKEDTRNKTSLSISNILQSVYVQYWIGNCDCTTISTFEICQTYFWYEAEYNIITIKNKCKHKESEEVDNLIKEIDDLTPSLLAIK